MLSLIRLAYEFPDAFWHRIAWAEARLQPLGEPVKEPQSLEELAQLLRG